MTISAGSRIGDFEVSSVLGEGGMGTVWRATDARLGRAVALKLLPDGFADDPDRHTRFEREARTLAALNHPNIATLYGLEHLDGRHVLVMELVEGEGLDEVVARGPLPVDEAVAVALQIADALEAAHEAGIVHRDLKPANIRVRPDGTVKVLDFGLAKAWQGDGNDLGLSLSPTVTSGPTAAGLILGTAAYMSPEQARGKPVDKRSDIWAFGAVLWEMLTGRRLFEGETVTDVLASVLRQDIDWTRLPASTPAALRGLLRRLLERKASDRIRDIGDVRWELARIDDEEAEDAADAVVPGGRRGRPVLGWIGGAALGALVAAGAALLLRPSVEPTRAVRSFLVPPSEMTFNFHGSVGGPALSPDGTHLVFAAQDRSGRTSLWVQRLDAAGARELEGTDGASYPFWSPDGRSVAFFVPGRLRRVDIGSGRPQTICDAANGRGGSWSAGGVIVFAPDVFGGLVRVPATGGTPTALVELDASKGQSSARWPSFLPDGRRFLYWAGGPLNSRDVATDGVYLGSLDGDEPVFLFAADSNALYAPPGYLLYLREQSLMTRRFDLSTGRPASEAVPLVEHVANPENYRLGDFSVSRDGTLVCQVGTTGQNQLVWLDEAGRQVAAVGEPGAIRGMSLSPDGTVVAEEVADSQSHNGDIWLVDLGRGVRTRFTFDPGIELAPVFSPDGDRIAYSANPGGNLDIFVRNVDGSGAARPVLQSKAGKYVDDWSPDGRFLMVTAIEPSGTNGADIWIVPLDGGEPKPFLATPFNESNAALSPNGRWLAYNSAESGVEEVYVTAFPGPGGKWQMSLKGGSQPVWRRDGRALYFRAPDGAVWEVAVSEKVGAVEAGSPRLRFAAPRATISSARESYAVSRDGDRLLVLVPQQRTLTPLTLITSWPALLDR